MKGLERLEEWRRKALEGGGRERVEKQHAKGKLTARERLERLLDPGSFEELEWLTMHRSTLFGLAEKRYPGDGVVTGYGRVDGRLVYVFAQDFTVLGGSIGERHGEKIRRTIKMAARVGVPVIGFFDSGGARIQEGVQALHAVGRIFSAIIDASGMIPQIAVMAGPCAGGAAYAPALMDLVVMVEKTSYMFITGPQVVKQVTGEEVTFEQLGGAKVHAAKSGVAHFLAADEEEAIRLVKRILSYLPDNHLAPPPVARPTDPPERECRGVESLIPDDPMKPYDMMQLLREVFDDSSILEVHRDWARNIITAFARLGGYPVCVVANQPAYMAGVIDIDAADKAARFIRLCDSFNLPIIMVVDVPGYMPGVEQEHGGIIRHGAKMLYAYREATVPKITLIARKAYGGAYIAMGSRALGADIVYAYPSAEIAVMGPEAAIKIIYRRELAKAENPDKLLAELVERYREEIATPFYAAQQGLVDDIIEPSKTRIKLYHALQALLPKRLPPPRPKHRNMPV